METVTVIGFGPGQECVAGAGAAVDGSDFPTKARARTNSEVLRVSAELYGDDGSLRGSARHQVRLITPRYLKAFAKRQRNDTVDAKAIAEALLRRRKPAS